MFSPWDALDARRAVGHHPHMSAPSRRRNPFFALAALSSAVFIITILSLVASVFGDSRAPLARLLDRYAGRLIAAEVVAILITGFLALFVDRRQTLSVGNDSVKVLHDQKPPE